ncbi:MAG: hypothetical protein H6658_02170 [Ardenticatenaceae bacterium]|nr:hypothetical protein [Ardenticatenaceae bacterium]
MKHRIQSTLWSLLTAVVMFWLEEAYYDYCYLAWSKGHAAMSREDWLYGRWFPGRKTA